MALIAGLISSEMASQETGFTDPREWLFDCRATEEKGLVVADHTLNYVHDWRRFDYNDQDEPPFPTKINPTYTAFSDIV